jgi:hypothetical protein
VIAGILGLGDLLSFIEALRFFLALLFFPLRVIAVATLTLSAVDTVYLLSARAYTLTMAKFRLFFGTVHDSAIRAVEDIRRGSICLEKFDCCAH